MVKWIHKILAGGQDTHALALPFPPFYYKSQVNTWEKPKHFVIWNCWAASLARDSTVPLRRPNRFRKNITVKIFWHLVHLTSVYMVEWQDSLDSVFSWVRGWQAAETCWGRSQLKPVYFLCVSNIVPTVSPKKVHNARIKAGFFITKVAAVIFTPSYWGGL